jgi:hypothetical protein
MRKVEDRIIYRDPQWYSTFPSLVRGPEGDLLCSFRRAPREEPRTHIHSRSRAMITRSSDDGRAWTDEPQPVAPQDELGQQDPQLAALSDGRITAGFFRWQAHSPQEGPHLAGFNAREAKGCLWSNAGVGVTWSEDDGRTWGRLARVPSPWWPRGGASRAPIVELAGGRLVLPCYGAAETEAKSIAYLMASDDGGESWELFSVIADGNDAPEPFDCHEPFVIRAGGGKLVCFLRCYGEGGLMRMCTSDDEGAAWTEPVETSVWGFPQAALEIEDGRIVLAYGYRREPWGVRARILGPDLGGVDETDELVLRDDGDDRDLGYPTIAALADGTVLVAYYIHSGDGVRHIAATVVDPE